jgi:threonine/homoserine/homoserine lactone efflux protein
MELQLALSIALFAITTAITPGPNNTILLATGLNYGFRAAWPFLMGVISGMGSMLIATGLGLTVIFHTFPIVYQVLKYVGFGYILYMAFGIIRSSGIKGSLSLAKPFGFFKATGAQWLNPKAWIVVPSFVAGYVPVSAGVGTIGLSYLIFIIVTLPGAMAWAAFGQVLGTVLKNDRQRKVFNYAMAGLLVVSMVPVVLMH